MQGSRLGPYEILEPLGAGGMGEVWRARDPRLQRDVAIKLLPEEFAADPERLARLQREAQVLAALEHANVAAVYGLEEAEGVRFLIMQLASGKTLAERIAAAPVPLDEAVPIALQIARGLEAAHERGIVHRDLKPANIMLASDGGVKILDFGLAKAAGPDASSRGSSADLSASPTVLEATQAGAIMGTAAYMSPEQARGRPVDKRADIWAWGCLVYEMLTGRPLFNGETASDVIAAVLRQEMDLNALPAGTPGALRALLHRCLERDPTRRLRDIGEARIVLEAPADSEHAVAPAAGAARRAIAPVVLAIALAAGLVGLAAGRWLTRAPAPSILELDVAPAGLQTGQLAPPAISPDGRRVLYRAQDRLWLRELDNSSGREIPGTEGVEIPFWAPGSDEFAYVADGRLWTQRLDGGAPLAVADVPSLAGGAGAVWRNDGTIVYAQGSVELAVVPARGGQFREWLVSDNALQEAHFHRGIEVPGGAFVYIRHTLGGTADTIAAVRDGERSVLLTLEGEYLSDVAYSPLGALLFSRRGSGGDGIWVVPFDAGALAATGDPVMLVPRAGLPSLSADGRTLVYDPSLETVLDGRQRIVLVSDLGGAESAIAVRQLTDFEALARQGQRISPDGRDLVFSLREGGASDLWVVDLDSGARRRLTDDEAWEGDPAWSADGGWVYFSRNDVTIARVPADGGGPAEILGDGRAPAVVSGTERLLVLRRSPGRGAGSDLWWLDARPGGAAEPFRVGQNAFGRASVAPTGTLVAYASNENGRGWEVFVEDLTDGRRWQVSTAGGQTASWGPEGNELYYVDLSRVIQRVTVTSVANGTPSFGAPERVNQLTPSIGALDVTPVKTAGGIRFLTTEIEAVASQGRLVIVIGADRLIREALGR
jgi:Tol biopolymer transport system component/tRNA A-37 threonylcarbamoyl transferase component Bud32